MVGKRFEALDGWRGFAALAVAVYHVPIEHPLRHLAGWKNMELFVDFFFVLSGFVIMHAWGARLDGMEAARRFAQKRFWRIWPLHFTILLAFLAIELMKLGAGNLVALPTQEAPFTNSRSWEALISNILMLQALNTHGSTTWNAPAWSISVEFWSYLLFALVLLAFRGKNLGRALLAVAALGLAGVAYFSPIYLFATHDFGLFRAVYGFFLGAATYRLMSSDRVVIEGGTGVEIAVVLALASYLMSTGVNLTSLVAPLIFAGIIMIFCEGRGALTRVLESRPVQALGLWSYSIYLVHALLFYTLRLALVGAEKVTGLNLTAGGAGNERYFSTGSLAGDLGVIAGLLALTVAISALTYRHIERRFMDNAAVPATRAGTHAATA
jgi:peptidoglycan/LPS O-acetylase OafA/YrhL